MATTPTSAAAVDLAEQLFNAAFDRPRDARSAEYKAGARALLDCRIHGTQLRCPHPRGSAQADAFFYGVGEGNHIWREHVAKGAH